MVRDNGKDAETASREGSDEGSYRVTKGKEC